MRDALLLALFPALMIYAAISDVATMTISNRLSLILAAGFAAVALLMGLTWAAIGLHLLAGALVLCIGFALFAAGLIGGGDAKLAAATALWLGFGGLVEYALIAALAGGALTLLLLSWRRLPLFKPAANWEWTRRLHDSKTGVPYGVALAIGGLMACPHAALWRMAASA